jgi:hypothetical protein
MDALQMSKGSVMSWEATWQKEKHSKGHFISHKEDVGDIVSISLNFVSSQISAYVACQ